MKATHYIYLIFVLLIVTTVVVIVRMKTIPLHSNGIDAATSSEQMAPPAADEPYVNISTQSQIHTDVNQTAKKEYSFEGKLLKQVYNVQSSESSEIFFEIQTVRNIVGDIQDDAGASTIVLSNLHCKFSTPEIGRHYDFSVVTFDAKRNVYTCEYAQALPTGGGDE